MLEIIVRLRFARGNEESRRGQHEDVFGLGLGTGACGIVKMCEFETSGGFGVCLAPPPKQYSFGLCVCVCTHACVRSHPGEA